MTMTNAERTVAIVTGASQGLGQAIAERLGHDGATVLVAYRGAEEHDAAERVAATVLSGGSRASTAPCDVTSVAQIEALFAVCRERYGRPDVVVSNAGMFVVGALADVTEQDFARVFDVNAKGALFVLKSAAEHVRDGGRIVQLSSSTTMFPAPGSIVYAGSKAAIKQFTEVAAQELAPRGITVNTVMPGVTETPMTSGMPPEMKQMIAAGTPLAAGTIGQPAEIADVVSFLASDDARWITGQHLLVNGGARH